VSNPQTTTTTNPPPDRISTGIDGLDATLNGGLTRERVYLIEGNPGSGKTTLGLQFLLDGVKRGESTLYVTLSETTDELQAVAASHGWNITGVPIYEMSSAEKSLLPEDQLTMFHPSELELSETIEAVLKRVEELQPTRVVFDSLSELRLLAQNPLRFRRQILGLKQFFKGRNATVLLLDDRSAGSDDVQLQSIAHGVIFLEQLATEYGVERRQLRIVKMRGIAFRGGLHDFVIRRGGIEIFPRLVASEHQSAFDKTDFPSGNAQLDSLLAGGVPPGSSTLMLGPAGTGKSTISVLFCIAAAKRGECSAIYLFDETIATMRTRMSKLGLPLDSYIERGLIAVKQIDSAALSPGEFAGWVYRAVAGRASAPGPARIIVLDSLNGYLSSMGQEKQLTAQLHELFTYLNHRGVATLFTVTQSGMISSLSRAPLDTTYLADNVILFRYFENRGQMRKAISVAKKRTGPHESTIRELRIGLGGIQIGKPLSEFQGVLTGVPTYIGSSDQLIQKDDPDGE
jgi:circadian clock protein KaiC